MFAVPAHERDGAHASGQPSGRFLFSPLHPLTSMEQTRPRRRWPGSCAGLCLPEARPAQAGPQPQGHRSKVAHPSHGQVLRAAVLPLPIVQLAATALRATLRAVAGAMASPPLTRRPFTRIRRPRGDGGGAATQRRRARSDAMQFLDAGGRTFTKHPGPRGMPAGPPPLRRTARCSKAEAGSPERRVWPSAGTRPHSVR